MYKYVIFDFDGTIADSDQVATEVLGELGAKYHIKNLSAKEIKHKSDLPFFKKVRLFLFIRKVNSEFKDSYGEKISSIHAFAHMLELLQELYAAGYRLAIISSNGDKNIRKFLDLYGVDLGITVLTSKGLFGKHKAIREFLLLNDCTNEEVLYVGDEIRDIKACHKAGVDICFVRWGFDGNENIEKYKPQHMVASPEELKKLLQA